MQRYILHFETKIPMIHIEHVMLPIEHCPSVFYDYFCTREEKIEHYGDF